MRELVYMCGLLLFVMAGMAQEKKAATKPAFDYNSAERTSAYLWQWRVALAKEQESAARSGNDLAYQNLAKRFDAAMESHIGKEVKWVMRFGHASNGQVFLAGDYQYRGHGMVIGSDAIGRGIFSGEDAQEIEPWMAKLKVGQAVKATGVIDRIDPDTVHLRKVRISP